MICSIWWSGRTVRAVLTFGRRCSRGQIPTGLQKGHSCGKANLNRAFIPIKVDLTSPVSSITFIRQMAVKRWYSTTGRRDLAAGGRMRRVEVTPLRRSCVSGRLVGCFRRSFVFWSASWRAKRQEGGKKFPITVTVNQVFTRVCHSNAQSASPSFQSQHPPRSSPRAPTRRQIRSPCCETASEHMKKSRRLSWQNSHEPHPRKTIQLAYYQAMV